LLLSSLLFTYNTVFSPPPPPPRVKVVSNFLSFFYFTAMTAYIDIR
jgi:hypothetical protein